MKKLSLILIVLSFGILFFFSSETYAALFPHKYRATYPDEWWKPIDRKEAKWWEILPQDAKPGEVILSKRTPLGILSNLAPTPFEMDGKRYASIEGFWQMMKYPDPADPADPRHRADLSWPHSREEVSSLSGFEAKRAGEETQKNYEKLDLQWISYQGQRMFHKDKDKGGHYQLILKATRQKIAQNKEARELLIATGDLVLRPDHHQDKDAPPAYRYYDILMKIRK